MDGPAASYFQDDLSWIDSLDLLVTVSRVTHDDLQKKNYAQSIYLAHGVDADYYQPVSLSESELNRFNAPMSFVGRSSSRRVELLRPLTKHGLVVWGNRWSKKPVVDDVDYQPSVREKDNVIGEQLNTLYNGADVVLNVLQREAFSQQNTMLSLQVFAVPAAGVCLLTEWVDELEEAFDIGSEILAFKTADELVELALKYSTDTQLAKNIGMAGRKRCLADHTHQQRAKTILEQIR
jgi:spore maturation protein CgeB